MTQTNNANSSAVIRQRFLDFFKTRDHEVLPSAPLVPDDATLLFVNAGMVPFKDVFVGQETRRYTRAASSQKCMRVSGKHNDLETVGPSPRHHTFFEMLGNFSFGDYFKREAIQSAWMFATEELGVDPERLIVTVHREDEEARGIWVDEIGRPEDRVLGMSDATNFWMMADVGPCGPTSELHYDFGPEACTCKEQDCSVLLDNGCDRWLEVWNLVFMQFDQALDGSRRPLPSKGVDTGMGLERITCVVQGVGSTYETDLFSPILDAVARVTGDDEDLRAANLVAYRVIADHARAMTFLIADGVLPGNDGRNYVLRLIMRRAMRFGRMIGLEDAFLGPVVRSVIDTMGPVYPELVERAAWIDEVVAEEEVRFGRTLDAGLSMLDDVIDRLKSSGGTRIEGQDVFRLYDTFGFPPDLTRIVAEEHGLEIDQDGYAAAMRAQRERARAGAAFDVAESAERYRRLGLPAISFTGYAGTEGAGTVLALNVAGEMVEKAVSGDAVEIVIDPTPFYSESGGQVGDTGKIVGESGQVEVDDTRKVAGITIHVGRVSSGVIRVGESIAATVDSDRRDDIRRNHTATHLLHLALQQVVGEHAEQRGSLVAPDRLRFDFAHLKPLAPAELRALEATVNAAVRADYPIDSEEMEIDDARRAGATMLFGEKYGDVVRVVSIDTVSKELCGGTHLDRTGQIGGFVITSEGSVGAGLRRIEAVTGRAAEALVRSRLDLLQDVGETLGVQSIDDVKRKLEEVLDRQRELSRELDAARARLASADAVGLADSVVLINGVQVLAARVDVADSDALRGRVDALRDALGEAVIVLGAEVEGKPRIVASVSDSLVPRGLHAGNLVKAVAEAVGGGGGGRPTMAEAGGKDIAGLDAGLSKVAALVERALE